MRRRRHKQSIAPTQNLDSFLDILTNTVGVLMFVSLFVSLVAVESATIVRTPLASNTTKKPHFFEVRGNKVTYIERETVIAEIKKFSDSLTTCDLPTISDDVDLSNYQDYIYQLERYKDCRAYNAEQLGSFNTKTSHYQVKVDLDSIGLIYEPLAGDSGELPKELVQSNSEFKTILKKLNPQTDYYLAFVVRPDSFDAFRRAREIALKDGFNVGWEPMNADAIVQFSSEGRTVGVQ